MQFINYWQGNNVLLVLFLNPLVNESLALTPTKVTTPKRDTCFDFSFGGEGLICALDHLISKWVGSVGKMVSQFLEAI
jgi:hypothetical protein